MSEIFVSYMLHQQSGSNEILNDIEVVKKYREKFKNLTYPEIIKLVDTYFLNNEYPNEYFIIKYILEFAIQEFKLDKNLITTANLESKLSENNMISKEILKKLQQYLEKSLNDLPNTEKLKKEELKRRTYFYNNNKHLLNKNTYFEDLFPEGLTVPKIIAVQDMISSLPPKDPYRLEPDYLIVLRGIKLLQETDPEENLFLDTHECNLVRQYIPDNQQLLDNDFGNYIFPKKSYSPLVISDLATNLRNQAKTLNKNYYNFTNLDSIKYQQFIQFTAEEEYTADELRRHGQAFKLTPLYEDKREKLEDSFVSINKELSPKELQEKITNIIIELCNKKGISLKEFTAILLYVIQNNGTSKGNLEQKYTNLSYEFQKITQKEGIYTGRQTNLKDSKIGLRLKRLPKSFIQILKDSQDKFITKENRNNLTFVEQLSEKDRSIIDTFNKIY